MAIDQYLQEFVTALGKYSCTAETDPAVWHDLYSACDYYGIGDERFFSFYDSGRAILPCRVYGDTQIDEFSEYGSLAVFSQDDFEHSLLSIPPIENYCHGSLTFKSGTEVRKTTTTYDSPLAVLNTDLDQFLLPLTAKNRSTIRRAMKALGDSVVDYPTTVSEADLLWGMAQCKTKWGEDASVSNYAQRQLVFIAAVAKRYPELVAVQRVSVGNELVSVAVTVMREGIPCLASFISKPAVNHVGTFSVARLCLYLATQGHTIFDPAVNLDVGMEEDPYRLYKQVVTSVPKARVAYAIRSSDPESAVEYEAPYLCNGNWVY